MNANQEPWSEAPWMNDILKKCADEFTKQQDKLVLACALVGRHLEEYNRKSEKRRKARDKKQKIEMYQRLISKAKEDIETYTRDLKNVRKTKP